MSKFKRISANMDGRDFVVGDIHGMFPLLENTLEKTGFDRQRDRLFCVGDLIDRGSHSPAFLDYLQYPWFYSLMGNHEYLALSALKSGLEDKLMQWIINGGGWILDFPKSEHERVINAVQHLPLAMEIELRSGQKIGLVHAEAPVTHWQEVVDATTSLPEDSWDFEKDSLAYKLLWSRTYISKQSAPPIEGIDHLYQGHTILPDVTTLANRSYIDIGSFTSQKLAVLEL